MKRTKYLLTLVAGLMLLCQCSKENLGSSADKEFLILSSDQTEFFFPPSEAGVQIPLNVAAVLHSAERTGSVSYSFEVLSSSTAVEGVHYSVESYSGNISQNNYSDTLTISVLPSGLAVCETVTLDIQLISSDLEETDSSPVSLSLNLEFESDLAGIVNYEHAHSVADEDLTGQVEILETGIEGEYTISDFSFGAWAAAFGIAPPSGTLKWNHICTEIRLSGTDNYGDVWQMDEVLASDGPVFSFSWSNTYGESGTVHLTREDGANWPFFELK